MFFQVKKKPSNLVRRDGNKLYINIVSKGERWALFNVDGLNEARIINVPSQENGYNILLIYDDGNNKLGPSDHSMGWSLEQANEIIFAV